MHRFISEGTCIEYRKGIYAELDGEIVETFETELPIGTLWDVRKIPQEELGTLQILVEERDLKNLILFHNKYKLSENSYCCYSHGVIENFEYILKRWNHLIDIK